MKNVYEWEKIYESKLYEWKKENKWKVYEWKAYELKIV